MPIQSATSDGAPERYAAFVVELLAEQDARKASIEQRGLAVITTSGTLVTILFALVALLTKANDYKLPTTAHGPLFAALALFATAGVLALTTNLPLFYKSVTGTEALAKAKAHWQWPEQKALQELTATRVVVLERARTVNKAKAWLLMLAMIAEVVAVILLAIAVGDVLRA